MSRGYRSEGPKGQWLWVLVKKESGKAWLCWDGEKDHWIPKSQIIDSTDDIAEGVVVRLEVQSWIADRNEYNVGNDQSDVFQRDLPLREPAIKIDDDEKPF
jgi:hypothetical protein